MLACQHCGHPLPAPKRGQPQKYCSSRRKASFRATLCVPKFTEKAKPVPSVELMRSGAVAPLSSL